MNMSKNLLKGFAAIAMLCMVGAVFATPMTSNNFQNGVTKNVYFQYTKAAYDSGEVTPENKAKLEKYMNMWKSMADATGGLTKSPYLDKDDAKDLAGFIDEVRNGGKLRVGYWTFTATYSIRRIASGLYW